MIEIMGVLFTATPPDKNLSHVSGGSVCLWVPQKKQYEETPETFSLSEYCLDISFKWLLLNNEIRNFHIMRSPSRHTVNPVFSSTKFMAHLALGRGVSLFLSTHVDLLNSWCLYLKSATLECAARGPLTQWSSRTRGACRCLPHVRRSEYKHTRL